MQGGYLRDTRVVNPHSPRLDDLIVVARVESPLTDPATAPKQDDELPEPERLRRPGDGRLPDRADHPPTGTVCQSDQQPFDPDFR
jgi:hypothetical protein